MQIRPEQLAAACQKSLAPIYVVYGDEPLLVQESCDLIRQAARAQGFEERELFHAEANFDWQSLLAEANAMSLFASRKILELRIVNGKPGDKGSKALLEYCEKPSPDNLLLVILPKLDRATLKSKWATALDKNGVMVPVWPIKPQQLPAWLKQRMTRAGLSPSADAIDLLQQRVEGNLLAAAQEIEKLALIAESPQIDGESMAQLVADSARYNLYDLTDAALAGQSEQAERMLRGLLSEGVEPIQILWAIARDLRQLNVAASAHAAGQQIDWALKQAGVWDSKISLFRSALNRLSPKLLESLLLACAVLDKKLKGMRKGDPNQDLFTLVTAISGAIPLNAVSLKLITYN